MYDGSGMQLMAAMFNAAVLRWMVWIGLVLLTGALGVLMRTQWGQSNPLRNCIVLSLIFHLLLALYTTTVNIVSASGGGPVSARPLTVSLVDGPDQPAEAAANEKPWDNLATAPAPTDRANDAALPPVERIEQAPAPERQIDAVDPVVTSEPPPVAREEAARPEAISVEAPRRPVPLAMEVEVPAAKREDPQPAVARAAPVTEAGSDTGNKLVTVPRDVPQDGTIEGGQARSTPGTPVGAPPGGTLSAEATSSGGHTLGRPVPIATPGPLDGGGGTGGKDGTGSSPIGPGAAGGTPGGATAGVPTPYRNRVASDKGLIAEQGGGSQATEAAVAAALAWLKKNQSADGRWDAKRLGAGKEIMIDGQSRNGAGTQADSGITGLALLAYLGAGNTHVRGDHSDTVRKGLEYLMRVQAADGNLAGSATVYEKMYCHAMATFALSEAYAMSRDERMQSAVRRSVNFSVTAQHTEGGWRYQPGEPGDMSQLGWQLMALRSAELAGIRMPDHTRNGMIRFVKSVSLGKHGGLASYRPGHRVSPTMTAEALVCRQILGMSRENPAGTEAADLLMQDLPGVGQSNAYYWYYATLGLFQLQGTHWERWNAALQTTLLGTQRNDGDVAGSWDPDQTWGNYGGRAYNTALATLCLEVYYRYLPLYVEAASRQKAPE